ncbi:MAG TPA: hypothetical protein VFK89_10230 [Actinomycetota bacterium]|nr:hypothetical protein [Actinomycetota bacterium]
MDPVEEQLISTRLTEFLRANIKPGQEYEVAIHPILRRVLVFLDADLILSCSFEELIAGPGGSPN